MPDDSPPNFLPSKHLIALGNIVAYWAYLESSLEVAIWAFLNLDRPRGVIVTTEMGNISRMQAITMLSELHFPDADLTELKDVLSRIDAARIKRNDYIHYLWKHQPDERATELAALKISAKGAFKQKKGTVSINELEQLVVEINHLTYEMRSFVEVVFPDAHIPWPRIDDEEN